jgi:hypothetical protein
MQPENTPLLPTPDDSAKTFIDAQLQLQVDPATAGATTTTTFALGDRSGKVKAMLTVSYAYAGYDDVGGLAVGAWTFQATNLGNGTSGNYTFTPAGGNIGTEAAAGAVYDWFASVVGACESGTVLTATTVLGRVTKTAKIPWPGCTDMMKPASPVSTVSPPTYVKASTLIDFLTQVVSLGIDMAAWNPAGVNLGVFPNVADAGGADLIFAGSALLGYANSYAGSSTSYGQLTASGYTIQTTGPTGAVGFWTVADEAIAPFATGVAARLAGDWGTCAAGTINTVDCAIYGSQVIASAGDTAVTYVWAPLAKQ